MANEVDPITGEITLETEREFRLVDLSFHPEIEHIGLIMLGGQLWGKTISRAEVGRIFATHMLAVELMVTEDDIYDASLKSSARLRVEFGYAHEA